MTELPDAGQEQEMGISSNPEIQQIFERLLSTPSRDHRFQRQATQYLRDLEIEKVRGVQGFVMRINTLLDVLPSKTNSLMNSPLLQLKENTLSANRSYFQNPGLAKELRHRL